MIDNIYVPVEALYDYIKSGIFPRQYLKSTLSNGGAKRNYKKFVKLLKKAVKYLPPEIEVTVKAVEKAYENNS